MPRKKESGEYLDAEGHKITRAGFRCDAEVWRLINVIALYDRRTTAALVNEILAEYVKLRFPDFPKPPNPIK